jgi:hypothetical protein
MIIGAGGYDIIQLFNVLFSNWEKLTIALIYKHDVLDLEAISI